MIRPQQERRGNREAERLGRLEIDHQLGALVRLDGQVAGPGAFEDLVDIAGGGGTANLPDALSVGKQRALLDPLLRWPATGSCRADAR